jgi:Arc/MetJ-type ribon-helix-helix transcriptional regulator
MKSYSTMNVRVDPKWAEEMRMKAVDLGYYSFSEFIRESMTAFNKRRENVNQTLQVGA